ncbi:MAB_1171c family putative transporter [Streptomyces sp. NBC_01304]|uniref:MAB_1171c family putative transporter n=1 Tax=Streptomyces sp. NBC_01304 TaxID=2903818 RepID=UPI002E137111|nr:hypothetical protein OG430_41455 [Streptomyces sp. NBC_01304]
MRESGLYIPAALLTLALMMKLPALVKRRRDPQLWWVCVLLLLGASVFTFAAPPTIRAVNSVSGVSNLAAPFDYSLMTALSAACFILLIRWHGGPALSVRRATVLCVWVCAAVITGVFVLFFLGDAPVEQVQEFDTYYAAVPYLREMIILYLLASGAAFCWMAALCLRWSRQVDGWLKGALITLVVGYGITTAYAGLKLAAVAARWADSDWDDLSTYTAPGVAALGGCLASGGYLLPLAGPRAVGAWHSWRTYQLLGPLVKVLNSAPAHAARAVPLSLWASPRLRQTSRETAVHDGLLRVGPFLDRVVHGKARAAALRAGHGDRVADIIATAAMITAAVRAEGCAGADEAVAAAEPEPVFRPSDEDLLEISRAMNSAIPAAYRTAAVTERQHA